MPEDAPFHRDKRANLIRAAEESSIMERAIKRAKTSTIELPSGESAPTDLIKNIINAFKDQIPDKEAPLEDQEEHEPHKLLEKAMQSIKAKIIESKQESPLFKDGIAALEDKFQGETPDELDQTEEQDPFGIIPKNIDDAEIGEAMQALMESVQTRARFVLSQMADNPVAASNELDQLNQLMEGLKHVVGSARLSVYLHAVKQACEEQLPSSLTLTHSVSPEQLMQIMDLKEQMDESLGLDPKSQRLEKLKSLGSDDQGGYEHPILNQIASSYLESGSIPENESKRLDMQIRIESEISKLDKIGESLTEEKGKTIKDQATFYIQEHTQDALKSFGKTILEQFFPDTVAQAIDEIASNAGTLAGGLINCP